MGGGRRQAGGGGHPHCHAYLDGLERYVGQETVVSIPFCSLFCFFRRLISFLTSFESLHTNVSLPSLPLRKTSFRPN